MEQISKYGVEILGFYWTLGRFGTVVMMEAKDEKMARRVALQVQDLVSTATLVALPREEAHRLLE